MDKSESLLENEIHDIFWDFEIQMDQRIPTRRPDLVLINKKNLLLVDFAVPADHKVKIKSERPVKGLGNWKWEEESKPSRPQHC